MKRIFAGFALTTALTCHAENVTFYGVLDEGLTYTTNQSGHSQLKLTNGSLGSSKFGLVADYKLDNGYRAIGRVEGGFDINTGKLANGGRLFGRQAFAGLESPYGTITVGRQYDLALDSLIGLSGAGRFGGVAATHASDEDNMWGSYSLTGVIKYNSPVFDGFKFAALFGPAGGGSEPSVGSKRSASVSYANEVLTSSAFYSRIGKPATTLYDAGSMPVAGASFSNPITSPVFSGYVSAQTRVEFGAGVNYLWGPVLTGFTYTSTRFEDVVRTPSTPFSGTATFNNYEVLATYRLNPTWMLGASYDYTKAQTATYQQWNAGAWYNLSKQVLLYALLYRQQATGRDSTGQLAVAALPYFIPSSNGQQGAMRVGLRVTF
jgi:predicted porin